MKFLLNRFMVAFLALSPLSHAAGATQLSGWTQLNGPENSMAYTIRKMTNAPDVLFAFQNKNLYRDHNTNLRWDILRSPDNSNIHDILSPAYNKVLITTDKGLYVSSDFGDHWLNINKRSNSMGRLVKSGPNSIFLAANKNAFYYSNDNGLTWTQTEVQVSGNINAIAANNNVIVVASDMLSVSEDGGVTFSHAPVNADNPVIALAVNSKHEIFIVDSKHHLYRTNTMLQTWEDLRRSNVQDVQIDQNDAVYITRIGKYHLSHILKSDSNGKKWKDLFHEAYDVSNLMILDDNRLVFWTDLNLVESDKAQEEYLSIRNEFENLNPEKIFATQRSYFEVVTGYKDSEVYRFDGLVWEPSFNGKKLDINQFKGKLVITADDLIATSDDEGRSWEYIHDLPKNFHIDNFNVFGDAVLGVSGKKHYISYDLVKWKSFYESFPEFKYPDSSYLMNKTLFVALPSQIIASTDLGETWDTVLDKMNSEIHFLRGYENKVLLGVYYVGGIFKTTDTGKTWNKISTTIPETGFKDVVLLNEDTYVALTENHVYITYDGGQMWQELEKGIKNQNVTALFASNGHLFANTKYNGIFQAQ